jgi:hypothetical protein
MFEMTGAGCYSIKKITYITCVLASRLSAAIPILRWLDIHAGQVSKTVLDISMFATTKAHSYLSQNAVINLACPLVVSSP